ncbi:hypothetical protein ABPG72_002250, partial [Tetrahymena utriculariae]
MDIINIPKQKSNLLFKLLINNPKLKILLVRNCTCSKYFTNLQSTSQLKKQEFFTGSTNYSQASNTFDVLNCRATKCFDDFYACHSEKACLDQYNSLNKCMQSDCLSSNQRQLECYNDCKNNISNPHLSSYIACTDKFC